MAWRHVLVWGMFGMTLAWFASPAMALQSVSETAGVTVLPLGQEVGIVTGDALSLARVILEPDAAIPPEHAPPAAVIHLEDGRAGAMMETGPAVLTLAEGRTLPLEPGAEVVLAPGDALSYGQDAAVSLRNLGVTEATFLIAALSPASSPGASDKPDTEGTASFSVETLACPVGMTLVTLETERCQFVNESLIDWSISSDAFAGVRSSEEAAVLGATTVWDRLPAGTYFIDLTAERIAPGYADYFIPSSNQVTRQDERTTRVYFDSEQMRGSIRAYAFPKV